MYFWFEKRCTLWIFMTINLIRRHLVLVKWLLCCCESFMQTKFVIIIIVVITSLPFHQHKFLLCCYVLCYRWCACFAMGPAVQSVAQFMLSQADKDSRSPETGLCFISDKNFVLLGALFAYFIPSSVAIVFAVLCRAEVHQLETHLYRGGRGYDWSCRTSTGKLFLLITDSENRQESAPFDLRSIAG